MTREVVFVGAARTAIGSYGGSLKDTPPAELGALVIKTALERAGVALKDVGHVVLGNVIPSVPQDAYISRVAALEAGVPAARVYPDSARASDRADRPRPRSCAIQARRSEVGRLAKAAVPSVWPRCRARNERYPATSRP